MNGLLAVAVAAFFCFYMAVELGWGGPGPRRFVKRKPIWWIRWRRVGLYPPEPPDEHRPKPPPPVHPRHPETVD